MGKKISKSLPKETSMEEIGEPRWQFLRGGIPAQTLNGSLTFLLPAFLRHLLPLFNRTLALEISRVKKRQFFFSTSPS